MDAPAWLGIAWLEERYFAGRDSDGYEDARLWLNGEDDALQARFNERRNDVLVAAGGEIG